MIFGPIVLILSKVLMLIAILSLVTYLYKLASIRGTRSHEYANTILQGLVAISIILLISTLTLMVV